MDSRSFDRLIRGIYGLTLSQDGLQSLLNMLAENFRCRAFGIQVVARLDLHLVSAVSSDVSVTDMQHFLHEFSLLKPFLGVVVDIAAETSAGEIYLFSGGGLTRLEHGRAHCSHVLSEGRSIIDLLFREGDFFIQAVLLYDSEHPVDFHQLIRNVTLLMPHVHKSFRIFYRLEKYRNYVAGFELALDHLSKVRIPTESGHPFRWNSATRSDGTRPPVPMEFGHPFRWNSVTPD